jgi:hypothetical protein
MKTVSDIWWLCECGNWDMETWTSFKYKPMSRILEDLRFEPFACKDCGKGMLLSKVNVYHRQDDDTLIAPSVHWPSEEVVREL